MKNERVLYGFWISAITTFILLGYCAYLPSTFYQNSEVIKKD